MPTKSLGCWAVPLTPASPTMPIAKPAASPLRPTLSPAPSWRKLLHRERDTDSGQHKDVALTFEVDTNQSIFKTNATNHSLSFDTSLVTRKADISFTSCNQCNILFNHQHVHLILPPSYWVILLNLSSTVWLIPHFSINRLSL